MSNPSPAIFAGRKKANPFASSTEAEASKSNGKPESAGSDVTPGSTPSPAKRPYVRKPHLTDRPLSGNEGLLALKKQLEPKKRPVRRPRKTSKEKK